MAEFHELPKVVRTGEGLRDALFDEIDSLRNGTGDKRRALAIAELARHIIKVAYLEAELARQLPETTDNVPLQLNIVPTMKLGSYAATTASKKIR